MGPCNGYSGDLSIDSRLSCSSVCLQCYIAASGRSCTKTINYFLFTVLSVTESVLTLTAVSVERFFAIVYPLKRRMNALATLIVIAVTWLLSTAMASPQLVYRKQYELYWKNYHEIWCTASFPKVYIDSECNTDRVGRKAYYMVQTVVMFFIPILIMVATYTIIIMKMVFRKVPGRRVTMSSQEKAKKKVNWPRGYNFVFMLSCFHAQLS